MLGEGFLIIDSWWFVWYLLPASWGSVRILWGRVPRCLATIPQYQGANRKAGVVRPKLLESLPRVREAVRKTEDDAHPFREFLPKTWEYVSCLGCKMQGRAPASQKVSLEAGCARVYYRVFSQKEPARCCCSHTRRFFTHGKSLCPLGAGASHHRYHAS